MCKEFLWLSKIKARASHQAERIHVYIWPTLFWRTIINLGNYNLKHNEGMLLRKSHCSWMRSDTKPTAQLSTIRCSTWTERVWVFLLLLLLAGIEPSIFILGDEFLTRWTKPGTLPRISGSRQAIWFSCWSPELTLYPQRAPWSRAHVPFIIITKKALIILLTMELACTVLLKRISVRWNIKNPVS